MRGSYGTEISDDLEFRADIGVKVSAGYKERTVQECLNCKKPECNGCPATEREKK